MNDFYFDKIVNSLHQRNLDAIFIAPSEELKFILGETTRLCERFQGLIITKEGAHFYICNLLTVDEIKNILGKDAKVYGWFDGDVFTDTVKKALEDYKLIGKTIGVNSTVRAFNILEIMDKINVKFVNARSFLEEIRIIKTDDELESLRKAAAIADEAFKNVLDYIKPGITENNIKEKLADLMIEPGGKDPKVSAASGPNSGYPHHSRSGRTIQSKDIIIIDFGCAYKGMRTDMTRTIFIGGVTKEEREVYEIVLESNLAGESVAKEGEFIPNIDKAARDVIEKAGYGKYFTTRLGHGIGYMVHEAPDIKKSNEMYLEKGMAFTIEPGIYLDGKFGVRIEDVLLITDKGTEVLHKTTKDIIIL